MSGCSSVLPLEVIYDRDVEKWGVVTQLGNPCGPRLLKGVSPPRVSEWTFYVEQEANELCDKLTQHIENEWPKNKKKGTKHG